MLTKLILLFLTVGQILAYSYVKDGKRAELFEIMDTEVPTFRVTLPDEKFEELKSAMQMGETSFKISDKKDDSVERDEDNIYGVPEFEKVKNATMVVEINGTEEKFKKVTFDIGGSSARLYGRQGFNLKIRDKNKDLYGRTQFRIRSDPRDATYLRSKLSCDILNRMGAVSISANYIILYVNEEYFGFYVLMDAPKIPWVEQVFGEKNTKNLYKCKKVGAYLSSQCVNEDDEITDNAEWDKFIKAIDNAKTVEDIEDIFDVDQFLYLAAFDYLVGAWDHFFHLGHNFNIYKNKKNGKWVMIYYDFDSDIGQDVVQIEYLNRHSLSDKNYPRYSVRDWFNLSIHLQEIAVFGNLARFEKILIETVKNVFNPAILFPHIDEVKEFIRPYIVHDKTPGENGINPGVLNLLNPVDHSLARWDANSEFTTINAGAGSDAYGIKYWILERYRAVCIYYSLECDPVYMDENYQYPIDKSVEGTINTEKWAGFDWDEMTGNQKEVPTDVEEPTEGEEPTEIEEVEEPTEKEEVEEPTEVEKVEEPTEKEEVEEPTEIEKVEEPTEIEEPIEEPIDEPTDKPTDKPKKAIELLNKILDRFVSFLNGLF